MHYRAVGFTPPYLGASSIFGPHQYSSHYATGGHWQFPNNNPSYGNTAHFDNVMLSIGDSTDNTRSNVWVFSWYYRLSNEWSDCVIPDDGSGCTYAEGGNAAQKFINMETDISSAPYSGSFCYTAFNKGSNNPHYSDANDMQITLANCLGSCNACKREGRQGNNPKLDWVHYEGFWDANANTYDIYADNYRNFYIEEGCGGCTFPRGKEGVSLGGWSNLDFITGPNADDRGSQNNWRFFADIYVDTTYSRVILANSANYENATITEPQIPSQWSANSITVTANLGRLTGNTAYLFVFDADNNHNDVGYPVNIGH
jgi:hypothetical protein